MMESQTPTSPPCAHRYTPALDYRWERAPCDYPSRPPEYRRVAYLTAICGHCGGRP